MEVVTSSTSDNQNMYDYINGILMNPSVFIIIIVIIVLYVLLFTSLGKSTPTSTNNYNEQGSSEKSSNVTVIIIIIVIFAILAIINGIQYFFGIDVVASIKNIFSGTPEIDIGINQTTSDTSSNIVPSNTIPEIVIGEQVYNIPGNYYGYEDAKTLCTAYGSRLATYDEVEESYNKGGEWCNYGWSDGQMALFPTQKNTFNTLQGIAGHENDCGRPGVNGGFMANPRLNFGVNCYGYKPKMTEEEEGLMGTTTPYPKTEKDILIEKRVDYWKNKLDEILVSPFNYKSWSRI